MGTKPNVDDKEAKAKFHKGLNELLIELQAFRVERDSVSAKVFGDGEIYSVQFKEVYLKESPQENIKALERNIKELYVTFPHELHVHT